MIKSKDDILTALNEKFGEETSDDLLSLLEDITDTFDDLEARSSDTTNWKQKFEENDAEWRQKYRDRFFNSNDDEDDEDDDKPILTFEDLFK